MVSSNQCDKLYSKIIVGKCHHEDGRNYSRRCEVYFHHDGKFCPCWGMELKASLTKRKQKEKSRPQEWIDQ
jgi:hypothetical protein